MEQLDVEKLLFQMKLTGKDNGAVAQSLGVKSARTIYRMIKEGECMPKYFAKLASCFGKPNDYFVKESSQTNEKYHFDGNWCSYFVEYDGDKFVIIQENVIISADKEGYRGAFTNSTANDDRDQKFRWLKVNKNCLYGETYISNWEQPAGISLLMLRLLPNGNILDGHLQFLDDTNGEIISGRHMWIREDQADDYQKKMLDKEMHEELRRQNSNA